MTHRIMIVEDDPELKNLYTMAIEDSGNYKVVVTATDGEEAVTKFKNAEDKIDLIVMDQRIPTKRGIEAARDIIDIEPEIKILFASADSLAKFEAKSLGAVAFLQKPFEMSMLTSIIREVLEPQRIISGEEMITDRGQKYAIEPGYQYLIKEKNPIVSFDIFIDQVTHGYRGLCITRQHPKRVRVNYGLKRTPILWLSQTDAENTIDPSNISKLVHTIRNFVKENKESIVLLDGIEYLKLQNGFDLIMKYLNMINDIVMTEEAKLVLPINPQAFTDNELAYIEREAKVFGEYEIL
ncbi:MAG: DUF835 domain-containing protein [Euryarchaeota archaeon]|nr:DUF835 domain-containing protein [Euryarchaeota archaeon]